MLTSHAEIGIMIIFSFVGGHLEENETVVFGFLELRFIFLCPRNWRWRGGVSYRFWSVCLSIWLQNLKTLAMPC